MNTTTTSSAETSGESSPAPKKRILLLEDDDSLREMLKTMVRGWSFIASAAATLQQARHKVLMKESFAVVVSDYELPDGNGLQFYTWLRKEMQLNVPFLLMSGGAVRVPVATDDYEFLAKPFGLDEFRNHVERLSETPSLAVGPGNLTPSQKAMASVYARSDHPEHHE